MEKKVINRRSLIRSGLTSILGLSAATAVGQVCKLPTPDQPEGPFYPVADQEDKNNDLVRVKGHLKEAKGERITIKGTVTNSLACEPIVGALVEIWQACESGRYNHPGDPNTTAKLDPNFQYWGQAITNEKGEYEFLTIKPGHYPASDSWMRPAHIHYKVQRRGYKELTTQMYFKGDPYNQKDLILKELSPEEQKKVIVENHFGVGRFDITLEPV